MNVIKLGWWEVKCDFTSRAARRYRLDIEKDLIKLYRPILNFTICTNKKLYQAALAHSPQS